MTRRVPLALAWLIALFALVGCAGPTIDVAYPETASHRALLASVAPRKVAVPAVTDRRANKNQIGATPDDGKPIVTARPVADIVRDALVVELAKNGHEVVASQGDALVSVDVEEFSLDAVERTATTQYLGKVAIALAIADARTGERLFMRRYVGIRRQTADSDSKDSWRDIMDTALARTIRDVATDPDVAATIGRTLR